METTVVGVRFQEAGKIYYFEPGGYDAIDVGSYVVVETSRGVDLGRVVISPALVLAADMTETFKPIILPAFADAVVRTAESRVYAREYKNKVCDRSRDRG